MKVESLRWRIVGQFAVILLPVVAMLAVVTLSNAQRTAETKRLFESHSLALAVKERYGRFVDGAVDAVDSGALARSALAALHEAVDRADALVAYEGSAAAIAGRLRELATALDRDPSLTQLSTLREPISAARLAIEATHETRQSALDDSIRASIAASQRNDRVVAAVSLLVLLVTLWFIYQMIRGLTEPLRIAVDVAQRVAAGAAVDEPALTSRRDIGNLLGALLHMHRSLQRSRAEVEDKQHRLEDKVHQLAESQASLAEAQHLAHLGNWHWEVGRAHAVCSDELCSLLGRAGGSNTHTLRGFLRTVAPRARGALVDEWRALLRGARAFAFEQQLDEPSGETRVLYHQGASQADGTGRVARVHGTVQDITERKRAEEEIRRLALYDSLTGLPNRQFFREQLERAVLRAKRNNELLATLFIDLDRFKRINDTLGHATGDLLLREAAERLGRCVRGGDYVAREACEVSGAVARLGGDEFTVTLVDLGQPQDAAKVAARILTEMARPYVIEGRELFVTASVGIALYPHDGDSAGSLLRNADAAMYQAKSLGKNTFQYFTAAMNDSAFEKLSMESQLRHAIARGELVLHYQPKVDVADGSIAGVEALIRWQHPQWGLLPPGKFIPLAEEMGMIVSIGEWVLAQACRQAAAWRALGLGEIPVAVNLASPSFRQPGLVELVGATLREAGIPAHLIELEVTESLLMQDVEATLATLRQLRDLGVRLAVDDFGTGYSSLSYLRRFPIDQLKIDRSFVCNIDNNSDDAAISSAIISLGRSLRLGVVAEGVETRAQARVLRDQGCRLMQGFLFSRPVPAETIAALASENPPFSARVLALLEATDAACAA